MTRQCPQGTSALAPITERWEMQGISWLGACLCLSLTSPERCRANCTARDSHCRRNVPDSSACSHRAQSLPSDPASQWWLRTWSEQGRTQDQHCWHMASHCWQHLTLLRFQKGNRHLETNITKGFSLQQFGMWVLEGGEKSHCLSSQGLSSVLSQFYKIKP